MPNDRMTEWALCCFTRILDHWELHVESDTNSGPSVRPHVAAGAAGSSACGLLPKGHPLHRADRAALGHLFVPGPDRLEPRGAHGRNGPGKTAGLKGGCRQGAAVHLPGLAVGWRDAV